MDKLSTFKNIQLFLKLIGITYRICLLKMRFRVSMINDLGDCHEETVIANNEKEAKRNVQSYNPKSKVLTAKWVYK